MTQGETSIIYRDVHKTFGDKQVLERVNLDIRDGEFVVFVGPSGSGKSTLLRILAGLETVTSGKILIDGRDVTHLPPKERDLAMVFQNYALYSHMSVRDNIIFGMRIRKESKADQEMALERVVSLLQLDGLLERKPRQLSGGQRQRVAMARAIVRNPRAFLMDEPLSNLDARLRNEVRSAIIEQQRTLGVTTVYVTHDQVEAMTMAHRIVVLDHGIVQQVGTPEELYASPANMFVGGFIGNPGMNFIPVHQKERCFYTDDGEALPISLFSSFATTTQATPDVVIGIRPEHLNLFPSGHENEAHITGRINGREMLGAEYILQIRLSSGVVLQTRVPNVPGTPALGDTCTLYFSTSAAQFFDAKTGQRLLSLNGVAPGI